MRLGLFFGFIAMGACGGGQTPPQNGGATTSATTSAAASSSSASTAHDEPYDDPNESAVAISMAPLVTKATPKSSYPKAKTPEKDCYKSVLFSGDHAKDYAALIEKCGTPTGLLEYVKPANGKLHHI